MAVTLEIPSSIKFDINSIVQGRVEAFSTQRTRLQAQREADFQKAVADNTLSPEGQVAFRQQMVNEAKSAAVVDPTYVTDLEEKLAQTKTMAHLSSVRSQMNQDKAKSAAGLQSNQDYLNQLQDLLKNENNPDMIQSIQDAITGVSGDILNAKLALINSEAEKGTTDKSTTELNKALNDAQTQKAQALAAGDQARAASMDVVISGVQQQLVNIRIDTENNGLNINKSVQGDPLGYFQQLKNLVATSDSTTPIEYQGAGSFRLIAYSSEQAYWQGVLGNYLNTNFIKDLQAQYDTYLNNSALVSKLIPNTVLDTVQSEFQQLMQDPNLVPFANQLHQVSTQVLADAVNKNAAAIVDQYKVDNDGNKAISMLDSLSSKYGIDTSTYLNQVVTGAAKQTQAQIDAFQASVKNYMLQGKTLDQATAQAQADLASGKGGVLPQSAEQLATETPTQATTPNPAAVQQAATTAPITQPILNNQGAPTAAQVSNETVQSPGQETGATKPTATNPTFTQFVKTANNPTVYGVTSEGQYVAFENMDQFNAAASGGNSSATPASIQTVASAPSNFQTYSTYIKSFNAPAQAPPAPFSQFVRTSSNPTVYGITPTGQYVAFENQDQFNTVAGPNPKLTTVSTAPSSSVNYSDFLTQQQQNKTTTP